MKSNYGPEFVIIFTTLYVLLATISWHFVTDK